MPRIYADNQTHNMSGEGLDFINGAAAVAAAAITSRWTANSYAIDPSKHTLSIFDKMDRATLEEYLNYVGVAHVAGDTQQALVRKAENFASTKLLVALTITSVAGTASGSSKITVTVGKIGTAGNTLAFKTGPDPLTPLYKDVPGYTAFADGADIVPGDAADDTITVVELNAAGEVLARGTVALTVKA